MGERGRRQEPDGRTRAKEGRADGAVGAAAGREIEAWNARVVEPRVGPEHLSAVPLRIVGDPEARLKHLPVRRGRAVGWEREPAARCGHRGVEIHVVEHGRGRCDRVGLDLRFPPQAVVDRPPGIRLPGVLDV